MSIIRAEKTKDYSVISNRIFKECNISARAKGIFGYIMTLPDDWRLFKSELKNHFSEGGNAIDTAFKELEKAGYVSKCRRKNEKGGFEGWDYTIYEHPKTDHMENRKSGTEPVGKRQLLSTNVPIPDIQSTERNKIEQPFFKNLNGALPDNLKQEKFSVAWDSWVQYKKERREGLTPSTVKSQLKKLSDAGVEKAVAALEYSIEKGYQGFGIDWMTKGTPGGGKQAMHMKYAEGDDEGLARVFGRAK